MTIRFRSPLRILGEVAGAISAWRLERRTRLVVEALPRHIRKDIGWPESGLPVRRRDGWWP